MKVGFLGNTNNLPFMIARALRNMGHDILFVLDSCLPLHRPENRYREIRSSYPRWIYDVSPLRGFECVMPTPKRARIRSLLKGCDAVVLNHFGPALLTGIDRPAIAFLTGDDLESLGDFRTLADPDDFERRTCRSLTRLIRGPLYRRLIRAQRNGIRSAIGVSYYPRGLVPNGDRVLDEIGVGDAQRLFLVMMTDVDKLQRAPLPHRSPVRAFCSTRLTWKKPRASGTSELDYKGSDVMIRGLALFSRVTGIRLDIRLVKKGMHVAETMRLVEVEGLGGQVTWLEEMDQVSVWEEVKQADIIFEQFGEGMVGIAALDAMALGRPVIANCRREIIDRVIGVRSPICHGTTTEEVCGQLQRLVPNRAERERIAFASRKYVEAHFSAERAARICLDRLAAAGRPEHPASASPGAREVRGAGRR